MDDLISRKHKTGGRAMTRQEAIERFQQMKKILSIPNSAAARTIEAIDMAIEALDQEPKQGKWEHYLKKGQNNEKI